MKMKLFEIQRRLEGEFNMDGIMQDIDTISGELVLFYRFIWQAKQLLLKITKKHDKFTKYKVNTWFLVRLEKEEFWNPKIGISFILSFFFFFFFFLFLHFVQNY